MTSQLENELFCIKIRWGIYEQNNIVNSDREDDWTAELVIIVSYTFIYSYTFWKDDKPRQKLFSNFVKHLIWVHFTFDYTICTTIYYFSLAITMKSPTMVLVLLGLFAFVWCSSDDLTVLKRCTLLGLNTFVTVLKEMNLTQLLDSYLPGGRHNNYIN